MIVSCPSLANLRTTSLARVQPVHVTISVPFCTSPHFQNFFLPYYHFFSNFLLHPLYLSHFNVSYYFIFTFYCFSFYFFIFFLVRCSQERPSQALLKIYRETMLFLPSSATPFSSHPTYNAFSVPFPASTTSPLSSSSHFHPPLTSLSYVLHPSITDFTYPSATRPSPSPSPHASQL
jgi:hypothetical protein